MNFFEFLAQEVREHLAALGFRTLDEAIGQVHLLERNPSVGHGKPETLDLEPLLREPSEPVAPRRHGRMQDHGLDDHFDVELIAASADALERGEPVVIDVPVRNTDRAVGTMLGHAVTSRYGAAGLPPETIDLTLTGTAGQSLGAFLPRGVTVRLHGDANDFVGKGLSGGDIVIRPHPRSTMIAESNVAAGNVIGYGATSGSIHIRGVVGERFLVRNSGATGVAEGVGDHALEYMTGGVAVVLGATGRNLGAGMSGGVAFIHGLRPDRVNPRALERGELVLGTVEAAHAAVLRDILTRHVEVTGSTVAARMLRDFDDVLDEFVAVMGAEYAAALHAREEAERAAPDSHVHRLTDRVEVTRG